MTDVDELVRTLLYEGYALYPYTPGATKNATPTPFGIAYPPAYAAGSPTTFDHLRMAAIVEGDADTRLAVEVQFLEPSGERHEAVARRVDLPATTLADIALEPVTVPFDHDAVRGRARMNVQPLGARLWRVTTCVHNLTDVPDGLDRAAALRHALLSTHVLARVTSPDGAAAARFCSPISPPEHAAPAVMTCVSVNTFPVLVSDTDDALLGAAIVLPDHPQLAPESHGDLFDGTEIEEALLLHVLALSDGERDEIAAQDPAVRAMIERAVAATPEDIKRLHGRVTVRDPAPLCEAGALEADRDVRGEEQLAVDGVTYRRGAHVRLHAGDDHAAHDHLLDGRMATIERIYVDYEDNVHLCVTVDDDPGQDLMRDIGRYLYFKPSEVELV